MPKRVLSLHAIFWILALASLGLYGLDYLIFGRIGEIGFSLLGNLAFLPVYVLFVTLMVEQLLKQRERDLVQQKLNMAIGTFFSEMGSPLLKAGRGFVQASPEWITQLKVAPRWKKEDYRRCFDYFQRHAIPMDSGKGDLQELKTFLVARRSFMLALLGNPNLLEHDAFTDLLWAVFHLLEELEARSSFEQLSVQDQHHLSEDLKRAYTLLVRSWVAYLRRELEEMYGETEN